MWHKTSVKFNDFIADILSYDTICIKQSCNRQVFKKSLLLCLDAWFVVLMRLYFASIVRHWVTSHKNIGWHTHWLFFSFKMFVINTVKIMFLERNNGMFPINFQFLNKLNVHFIFCRFCMNLDYSVFFPFDSVFFPFKVKVKRIRALRRMWFCLFNLIYGLLRDLFSF